MQDENLGEMEEIRISIEEAEHAIALRDDINKMLENPLVNKVVGHHYFQEESMRLVSCLGEDNLDDRTKLEMQKMLYGIAYFQRWLRVTVLQGNEMEEHVKAARDELDREVDPEVN